MKYSFTVGWFKIDAMAVSAALKILPLSDNILAGYPFNDVKHRKQCRNDDIVISGMRSKCTARTTQQVNKHIATLSVKLIAVCP